MNAAERIQDVKASYLEGDGRISVIAYGERAEGEKGRTALMGAAHRRSHERNLAAVRRKPQPLDIVGG